MTPGIQDFISPDKNYLNKISFLLDIGELFNIVSSVIYNFIIPDENYASVCFNINEYLIGEGSKPTTFSSWLLQSLCSIVLIPIIINNSLEMENNPTDSVMGAANDAYLKNLKFVRNTLDELYFNVNYIVNNSSGESILTDVKLKGDISTLINLLELQVILYLTSQLPYIDGYKFKLTRFKFDYNDLFLEGYWYDR